MLSVMPSPYQLLEINIISAQDLSPISKSMKAYAVAWLHPERKLTTQIDQVGYTNPTWNEKFVFRVDDEFLNSDSSVIMIEIYSSAWLRDNLIGTVGVLVSNLIPPGFRSGNRKPKLRFVALQIRRPSGRPQGILNIGVTLLDSTMRSMPLYSELSTSAVGYWDLMHSNKKRNNNHKKGNSPTASTTTDSNSRLLTLQRCQSEKNDSSVNDYSYHGTGKNGYNGYVIDGQDSETSVPLPRNVESLCSDVGPSPSVVAAAIAKGLYPLPAAPGTVESSVIEGWSESNCTEGMNTKMGRWRTEMTPAYDNELVLYDVGIEEKKKLKQTPKRNKGKTPKRQSRRAGLFSCFAKVFGCEFSITCGEAGRNKKKRANSGKARNTTASELTYEESFA